MDIYSIAHDEKIFPDSFTFKPERWLNNPKGPDGEKYLSRYMVSFSRLVEEVDPASVCI